MRCGSTGQGAQGQVELRVCRLPRQREHFHRLLIAGEKDHRQRQQGGAVRGWRQIGEEPPKAPDGADGGEQGGTRATATAARARTAAPAGGAKPGRGANSCPARKISLRSRNSHRAVSATAATAAGGHCPGLISQN